MSNLDFFYTYFCNFYNIFFGSLLKIEKIKISLYFNKKYENFEFKLI